RLIDVDERRAGPCLDADVADEMVIDADALGLEVCRAGEHEGVDAAGTAVRTSPLDTAAGPATCVAVRRAKAAVTRGAVAVEFAPLAGTGCAGRRAGPALLSAGCAIERAARARLIWRCLVGPEAAVVDDDVCTLTAIVANHHVAL